MFKISFHKLIYILLQQLQYAQKFPQDGGTMESTSNNAQQEEEYYRPPSILKKSIGMRLEYYRPPFYTEQIYRY